MPISRYPSSATTLHFEYYCDAEPIGHGPSALIGQKKPVLSSGHLAAPPATGSIPTLTTTSETNESAPPSSSASILHPSLSIKGRHSVNVIHIEHVDQIKDKSLAQIMEELIEQHNIPKEKQMQLFTHLRLAHSFSDYEKRLQCVQARLQALSIIGE